MFRREAWYALELQRAITTQGVADAQIATIHDANHIARPRIFDGDAIAGHKLLRRSQSHRLARALMEHLHVRLKVPGNHADKRNAVAMFRIHVRLNLEHEAREIRAVWRNRPDR